MDFLVNWVEQSASTQSDLVALSEKNVLQQGYVLAAKRQYAGKGQGSNKWEAQPDKNLTFSLYLQPRFLPIVRQFDLMQTLSLAIADFVQEYIGQDVWIKWPNDIYIGKDKVCGFLIQNKIVGSVLEAVFCGIGININQTDFTYAPNPTSLALHTGRQYDLKTCLDNLLQHIARRYEQLSLGDIEAIKSEYLDRLLYKDVKAEYIYNGKKIVATIRGVNSFGHLILETEQGDCVEAELKQLSFTHKEV